MEKVPQTPSKSSWKWVLGTMVFGMVTVLVSVSLFLPRVFSWYFEPPASMGVSCSPAVRWAVERVLWFQGIAAVFGALAGLVFAVFWRSRRKSD